MPNKQALNFIASKNVSDLQQVRVPGLNKPFEQLTIGELTQLRPGDAAADSYNITAVGSDITVSTSSLLNDLAQLKGQEAVRAQQVSHQILDKGGVTIHPINVTLNNAKTLTNIKG